MSDDRPSRLSFDLLVSMRLRCSGPGCQETVVLQDVPLAIGPDAVPRLDVLGVQARIDPSGWTVGSLRPSALLLADVDSPAPRPIPVAFCPACRSKIDPGL